MLNSGVPSSITSLFVFAANWQHMCVCLKATFPSFYFITVKELSNASKSGWTPNQTLATYDNKSLGLMLQV